MLYSFLDFIQLYFFIPFRSLAQNNNSRTASRAASRTTTANGSRMGAVSDSRMSASQPALDRLALIGGGSGVPGSVAGGGSRSSRAGSRFSRR